MSVHKRNGKWQVKWREGDRPRSRTFTLKGDAATFGRELERRRQLGPALVRELTRNRSRWTSSCEWDFARTLSR
jgi:hypothetical protein